MCKLSTALTIGLLLTTITPSNAVFTSNNENMKDVTLFANNYRKSNAPEWADGDFIGTINEENETIGHVKGYIKQGRRANIGFFTGAWNITDTNNTGQIAGIFRGLFTFGVITTLGTTRCIPLIGTLVVNETHFTANIFRFKGGKLSVTGLHHESFLPQINGPYQIGTETIHIIDENREEAFTENPSDKRELIVQLWYPLSNDTKGVRADYMDDLTFDWLKHQSPIPLFWIPRQAYTYVNPYALDTAPLLHGNTMFPVIIFSHGYNGVRAIYTSMIEEIASHGFIVAAINHPYIAGITVFPDGRSVEFAEAPSDPQDAQEYFEIAFRTVVEDIRFTLDQLTELNTTHSKWKGRFDLSKVGVSGHSFGGGASAAVCYEDERFIAGVALDSSFRGDLIVNGIGKPFMVLLAEDHFENDQSLQKLWNNTQRDLFRAEVRGSTHYGYTDVGILLSHFAPLMPSKVLGFGTIKPKRLIRIINAYDLAFFNAYLKGKSIETLLNLQNEFEEVSFEYK
jgi:dienelactone hydrolase